MLMPEQFKRIPVDVITSAQKAGPLKVYRDHFWAITREREVLIYVGNSGRYNSPQCNVNRSIVERVLAQGLCATVELLPWAYLQFSPSEYL